MRRSLEGDGLRCHVSRATRIVPCPGGAAVLVSVTGPDGYVAPNSYADPCDQVPTWNYVAVACDGTCLAIDKAALDRPARRARARIAGQPG